MKKDNTQNNSSNDNQNNTNDYLSLYDVRSAANEALFTCINISNPNPGLRPQEDWNTLQASFEIRQQHQQRMLAISTNFHPKVTEAIRNPNK